MQDVERAMTTEFGDAHPMISIELVDADGEIMAIPEERLPRVLTWHVLLAAHTPAVQTKGGVLLPDQLQDANRQESRVFKVIRLGPLAFSHDRLRGGAVYTEEEVSPQVGSGTITKSSRRVHRRMELAEGVEPPVEGDWVIVRKFAGIKLALLGVELKLCNDEDIMAVIDSPSGWKAYVG